MLPSLHTFRKTLKIKSFGSSMLPLLQDGDTVTVKKMSFSKIQADDIVCIQKRKKYFTHRVIYKARKYLVTKGDNNMTSDGKIYPSQIVGKISKVKRKNTIFDPEIFYLFQSTLYFSEIVKINRKFKKRGVDFVFLKGLPIYLHYMKTHPRKIYLDCDILISNSDIPTIEEIFKESRYTRCHYSLSKTHSLLQNKEVEMSYTKLVNGFPVVFDIHTEAIFKITQLGSLDSLYSEKLVSESSREFLQEKKYVNIQSEIVPILSPENFILFLAHHFFRHDYRGIHRLEFLKNIILLLKLNVKNRYPTPSTEASIMVINEKIKKFRLENFVFPVFFLLNKHYKVSLSKEMDQEIKRNKKLLKYIKRLPNIFNDEERVERGMKRFLNVFTLSPNPLYKKLLTFTYPKVLFSIFWVIEKRFREKAKLFSLR